ncbi:hypothetical protein BH23ACT9_BH23ACT9_34830 [soil metagenome]
MGPTREAASFKVINDTHGHVVGDDVLRAIADRIRDAIRPGDVLSRYGDEEFAVLLPDTDDATAYAIGERLRRHIAEQPVPALQGDLWVTISVGIACRSQVGTSLDALLQRADRALYAAKDQGRNRVVSG